MATHAHLAARFCPGGGADQLMNRLRAAISDSYRHWHIVRHQAYASLRSEIARTYLGVLWWLLEPTLSALVMFFVVGVLFETKGPGFFPFLLVGTFAFQWLANSAQLGANAIVQRATLMQSVYLPKYLFPIISVISATWKFLFAFALLVLVVAASSIFLKPGVTGAALDAHYVHNPGLAWLALPLVLLINFAFNLAIALPLSALIPYFRDGNAVIAAVTQFLGFASGIFFDHRRILTATHPWYEAARPWFHYNPVSILLDAYRDILLDNTWPDGARLAWVVLYAAAGLGFGLSVLKKLDLELPKVSL